jgi:translation initiation factor eIF-2B subunit alpha
MFKFWQSWDKTSISLTAGCDLFIRYVTRTSALEYEDFNSAKSRLLERAEKFGEISCKVLPFMASGSYLVVFVHISMK